MPPIPLSREAGRLHLNVMFCALSFHLPTPSFPRRRESTAATTGRLQHIRYYHIQPFITPPTIIFYSLLLCFVACIGGVPPPLWIPAYAGMTVDLGSIW